MIEIALLFNGISQMSTHPKERETKGNTVSTLENIRGASEAEGMGHSFPHRGELGEF